MYACKSPHNGLGSAALKHIIGFYIYNKLIKNGGIVLDGDGHVVKILIGALSFEERRELTFDIEHLESLQNLTYIDLDSTGVSGNIEHLKSLQNLTNIQLFNTGVTGNIKHLESLPILKMIALRDTGVSGDTEAFHEYRNSAGLEDCYIYF